MTLSLVVVCEAPADQVTATGLADRVLCEQVDWIELDVLDDYRRWRGLDDSQPHLLWRDVHHHARLRGLRAHGHFGGEPQAPDAHSARLALLLLHGSEHPPQAVLLIRDDDGHAERREGLEQARNEAGRRGYNVGPVILGVAHPRRESWVLAGFEPRDEVEGDRLRALTQELSFDPITQAERLNDRQVHEPRSAKRVLSLLVRDDRDREAACWRDVSLALLRQRGERTGLTAYLQELEQLLVPLFRPTPAHG